MSLEKTNSDADASNCSRFPVSRSRLFPSFQQRSLELEHLDKGDYTPEEYEGCIVLLKRVNRWLGDVRALRHSLLNEIKRAGVSSFSVLDVGAGSGELLRVTAEWANDHEKTSKLVGLELNARSVGAIKEESGRHPEIVPLRGNALSLPFEDEAFDYGMCSLFTHHFRDDDVVSILRELARVSRRRIFLIDLYRHPVAYYFYITVGRVFLRNRLIREDGALSILRSFKPEELVELGTRAGLNEVEVKRVFPYRLVLSAAGAGVSKKID